MEAGEQTYATHFLKILEFMYSIGLKSAFSIYPRQTLCIKKSSLGARYMLSIPLLCKNTLLRENREEFIGRGYKHMAV